MATPPSPFLLSDLQSLGLLSAADSPSPTSSPTYAAIVSTLVEELHSPFPPDVPLEQTLEPTLRSLGYTGDTSNRAHTLEFLIGSAYAARALAHRRPAAAATAGEREDKRLASALSRIYAAVGAPVKEAPRGCAEVAETVDMLAAEVGRQVEEVGGASALGAFMLDGEDAKALAERRETCEDVLEVLAEEHALRRDMLLHRLDVTVQAFARSERAKGEDFSAVRDEVKRTAAREERVTFFEVMAAREWALVSGARENSGGPGVKTALMGGVPDRGGRVGAAAMKMGEMPGFRERESGATGGNGKGAGKGGWKRGKTGKRRRGKS